MRWRSTIPMIAILLGLGLVWPRPAVAHVGPPFPILVDQPIPGYVVTVWADPDVGESLFYVVLEPSETTATEPIANVELWVQPVSERLPKVVYRATQESARRHLRFVAKPDFDVAEPWTVGIDIQRTDGTQHRFVTEVEATPPGLGSWDLLIYLFPFVLFGGLWGLVFIRRSRMAAAKARAFRTEPTAMGPEVPMTVSRTERTQP